MNYIILRLSHPSQDYRNGQREYFVFGSKEDDWKGRVVFEGKEGINPQEKSIILNYVGRTNELLRKSKNGGISDEAIAKFFGEVLEPDLPLWRNTLSLYSTEWQQMPMRLEEKFEERIGRFLVGD